MGFNPASGNGGSSRLTPQESVTAFFHVLAMQYLGEIATAIGEAADASALQVQHQKGVAAYHARYYNAKVGGYSPCIDPPQPTGKFSCPKGQHLDVFVDTGDNGSCKCEEFCASDWSGQIKQHKPGWTGATSIYANTSADTQVPCQCVQATKFCPHGKFGCNGSCDAQGLPTPIHNCKPGPAVTTCSGTSSRGSQTSNAMALMLGAPPDAATAATVAKNLAWDVQNFGNKTTTGVSGIAWLFPALDQGGYSNTALAILLNDAYPSLGHMAHQNMTTLCENYACTAHEAGGGSQNHIMLGGFDAWLLASVGGLDSAVNGTTGGWRSVIARIAPGAVTIVRSSSYSKMTQFGEVSLVWSFTDSKLKATLSLPIGCAGTFHAPAELVDGSTRLQLAALLEQDVAIWGGQVPGSDSSSAVLPKGVARAPERDDNGSILTHVGSGTYTFEARYTQA